MEQRDQPVCIDEELTPGIGSYALLGDCHGAALVSRGGSVDWWCPPRCDAPSAFVRLLDVQAGHWSIRPALRFDVSREYVPGTMVMQTTFRTAGGVLRLRDALALGSGERGHDIGRASPHVLLRVAEAVEGEVPVAVEVAPRPGYGLVEPSLVASVGVVHTIGGADTLFLAGDRDFDLDRGQAVSQFVLREGDTAAFSATYVRGGAARTTRSGPTTVMCNVGRRPVTRSGRRSSTVAGTRRRAPTGSCGSENLDAGVLLMPIVGFLPANEERMRRTIDVISRNLRIAGWCAAGLRDRHRLRQRRRAAVRRDQSRARGVDQQLPPGAFAHRSYRGRLGRSTKRRFRQGTREGMLMGKLGGRVTLITGSDSGIGHASAVPFAEEGADVVVNYLHDEEGAATTKNEVEAHGRRAVVVQADHGYEDQVESLFAAAIDAFGKVDILMNNASVDASGVYVADLDIDNYERTLRSNLIGQVVCCKHFVRHRKTQGGGGKIINVTSIHQDIPNPGGADYDTSKSALRMLTRTLALEVAQDGINVNNLAPGMVLTPFNQKAIDDPDFREQQVQSIPMKRAARPEEIAKLALFLASIDSDYVTGATYVMDGGLMINMGQGA